MGGSGGADSLSASSSARKAASRATDSLEKTFSPAPSGSAKGPFPNDTSAKKRSFPASKLGRSGGGIRASSAPATLRLHLSSVASRSAAVESKRSWYSAATRRR